MRDLDILKFVNDKAFAEKHGWRVVATYHALNDQWGDWDFQSAAEAWEFAVDKTALEISKSEARSHKLGSCNLPGSGKTASLAQPPLKTYSVIGRYFDTGDTFHDGVGADDAKDAIAKVEQARSEPDHPFSGSCPTPRDWEVIAVLRGDGIEDVTPLEYIG